MRKICSIVKDNAHETHQIFSILGVYRFDSNRHRARFCHPGSQRTGRHLFPSNGPLFFHFFHGGFNLLVAGKKTGAIGRMALHSVRCIVFYLVESGCVHGALARWEINITARNHSKGLVWLYYFVKLDHLLCVPALLFLYFGLKRLLKKTESPTPRPVQS